jgi:hypothetical protein
MQIIRYSQNGFIPQFQKYHLQQIDYHLNGGFNLSDFPIHLQDIILKQHNQHVLFYKENFEDFQYGVWVFIKGWVNEYSLNHIPDKKYPVCWEAKINDNTTVYDINWEEKTTINNKYLIAHGCYIPEKSLSSLRNIKKTESIFQCKIW